MSHNMMEYMVWVVEVTAKEFFSESKGAAYRALRECGIWDIYINHYETTHTLGKEVILAEIKERLAVKGQVTERTFYDTALMRMVIGKLAKHYGWTYELAMDRFYNSIICEKLSDRRTGLFTCAPIEIVELFIEETEKEVMA